MRGCQIRHADIYISITFTDGPNISRTGYPTSISRGFIFAHYSYASASYMNMLNGATFQFTNNNGNRTIGRTTIVTHSGSYFSIFKGHVLYNPVIAKNSNKSDIGNLQKIFLDSQIRDSKAIAIENASKPTWTKRRKTLTSHVNWTRKRVIACAIINTAQATRATDFYGECRNGSHQKCQPG